jgi:hypothetical protein
MQRGLFREAGDSTIKASLDREQLSLVETTFTFILDSMDEIIQQSSLGSV